MKDFEEEKRVLREKYLVENVLLEANPTIKHAEKRKISLEVEVKLGYIYMYEFRKSISIKTN